MAKKDYAKTQALVRKLLNKFGDIQLVEKKSANASTYDPVTETFTGNTITTEQADGVLIGIDDSFLSNTLVKASDSMLLVIDFSEPKAGDVYTVNGKEYSYIAHKTVNPAGVVCLYKIALRL